MKGIFGIQIPDSPPPQQGALESIRGLTVLCTVYRLYLFLSLFLSFSITRPSPPPPKKAIVWQVYTRVLTVTPVNAVWEGHLQSGSDQSNEVQNAPFLSRRKRGKISPFTLAFCYHFQPTM